MSWRTLDQLEEIVGDKRGAFLGLHNLTGLMGFEDEIEYERRFKIWLFNINDKMYNALLDEKNYYNNVAERLEEEISNKVLQGIPTGDSYKKLHVFFDKRYSAITKLKIHKLRLELEYLSALDDEDRYAHGVFR